MKTLKHTLGISLLVISFLLSNEVNGQKRNNKSNKGTKTERINTKNRVTTPHDKRYRTQPVTRNPHYIYPRHRRVVRTLPRHHVRIVYRGLPYFYYSGIYYTQYGDEYIVVMPPLGFRITVLPVGYTRIVVGPSIYFYHSGIYYLESKTPEDNNEDDGKYEVVKPPIGTIVSEIHEDSEEVVVDGKTYYEYNDILYKKIIDTDNKVTYEVVYN